MCSILIVKSLPAFRPLARFHKQEASRITFIIWTLDRQERIGCWVDRLRIPNCDMKRRYVPMLSSTRRSGGVFGRISKVRKISW